jgi:threonine/homoserine/homoserine lactone efflux protein
MVRYLMAVVLVFAVLAGWIAVQHAARRFAARHPEFGRVRDGAGGCGACGCHGPAGERDRKE